MIKHSHRLQISIHRGSELVSTSLSKASSPPATKMASVYKPPAVEDQAMSDDEVRAPLDTNSSRNKNLRDYKTESQKTNPVSSPPSDSGYSSTRHTASIVSTPRPAKIAQATILQDRSANTERKRSKPQTESKTPRARTSRRSTKMSDGGAERLVGDPSMNSNTHNVSFNEGSPQARETAQLVGYNQPSAAFNPGFEVHENGYPVAYPAYYPPLYQRCPYGNPYAVPPSTGMMPAAARPQYSSSGQSHLTDRFGNHVGLGLAPPVEYDQPRVQFDPRVMQQQYHDHGRSSRHAVAPSDGHFARYSIPTSEPMHDFDRYQHVGGYATSSDYDSDNSFYAESFVPSAPNPPASSARPAAPRTSDRDRQESPRKGRPRHNEARLERRNSTKHQEDNQHDIASTYMDTNQPLTSHLLKEIQRLTLNQTQSTIRDTRTESSDDRPRSRKTVMPHRGLTEDGMIIITLPNAGQIAIDGQRFDLPAGAKLAVSPSKAGGSSQGSQYSDDVSRRERAGTAVDFMAYESLSRSRSAHRRGESVQEILERGGQRQRSPEKREWRTVQPESSAIKKRVIEYHDYVPDMPGRWR